MAYLKIFHLYRSRRRCQKLLSFEELSYYSIQISLSSQPNIISKKRIYPLKNNLKKMMDTLSNIKN